MKTTRYEYSATELETVRAFWSEYNELCKKHGMKLEIDSNDEDSPSLMVEYKGKTYGETHQSSPQGSSIDVVPYYPTDIVYDLEEVQFQNYQVVCRNLTSHRPDYKEMSRVLYGLAPCRVLIDLHSCNHSGNVYFAAEFDGKKINVDSVVALNREERDSYRLTREEAEYLDSKAF